MKKHISYSAAPFLMLIPFTATLLLWAILIAADVRDRFAPAALLLYGLLAASSLLFGYVAGAYLKRPWRYEVSSNGISVRRLWGQRLEIPWPEITTVAKVTRRRSPRRLAIASCAPTPPFRGLTTIRTR